MLGLPLSAALVKAFVDSAGDNWPCGVNTGIQQLSPILNQHGVRNSVRTFTAESLLRAMQDKHPVIAPVLTQNTKTGQIDPGGREHFMLVVGVTPTSVIANDPGRSQAKDGAYKQFALDAFIDAWRANSPSLLGIEVGVEPVGPGSSPGAFTVQALPSSLTLTQGSTAIISVSLQSSGGFNGLVTLSALDLPGNQVLIGTGFVPKSVRPSAGMTAESRLTIVTDSSTPLGAFDVKVRGTYGTTVQTMTVTLTVVRSAAVQPSAVTASAAHVGSTTATVAGSVNPNGLSTSAFFQWGTSTAYGNTTSVQSAGGGVGSVGMSATLNDLSPDSTYHARIVATSSAGRTEGNDVTFATTGSGATPQPPGKASGPSPTTGASGVTVTPVLAWAGAAGATSYDVYFGTTLPASPTSTTTVASYTPAPLAAGTAYSWRIDAKNAAGTTPGDVWTFTTAATPQPPGKASGPSPSPGATGVTVTPALAWGGAAGATSFDVYFGTTLPASPTSTTTVASYTPAPLAAGTAYSWRIDAKNAAGTTPGDVWTFTTSVAQPAPRITTPTPDDWFRGTEPVLTIYGTGFVPGLKVRLEFSGSGGTVTFEAPDVFDITATSFKFQPNLGGITGTTLFRIINPDGQASNAWLIRIH